jgi:hypothetical protein
MSTSGENGNSFGSKSKLSESKSSPTAVLTTIEKIEKLIDEIPEEFILDVQTALNRVFAHRLAAGAVICCHLTNADVLDIVATLQMLIVGLDRQDAESDEISANDQTSKQPNKKRRTKVSLAVACRRFQQSQSVSPWQERSEMEQLKALQTWLRDKVPVQAVMPTEQLVFSNMGQVMKRNSIYGVDSR